MEREVENDLITWERITVALMDDGVILRKRDVKFKPAHYETEGSKYSYGWTVKGKARPGTAAAFEAAYTKAGYTK